MSPHTGHIVDMGIGNRCPVEPGNHFIGTHAGKGFNNDGAQLATVF